MQATETKLNDRPVIFNIGYQHRTIEGFCKVLKDNEVTLLVDLREKPFSRIKGFSMNPLRKSLSENSIAYKMMGKMLGGFTCGQDLWMQGCRLLAEMAQTQTIAIMCMEYDYNKCHRRKLAELLATEFKVHNINL